MKIVVLNISLGSNRARFSVHATKSPQLRNIANMQNQIQILDAHESLALHTPLT